MKIRCLGCSGAYPTIHNGTTSFVVSSNNGYHLLLDAGSGSAMALSEVMEVGELSAVILTHDHPDHTADIGIYQHLFKLHPSSVSRTQPIPIYVHPNSVMSTIVKSDTHSELHFFVPTKPLLLGDFEITFCRTVHPIECYAVRIKEYSTGEVFVFTADSAWHEPLIEFCQEADLLLIDVAFSDEIGTNLIHFTAKEAGELANLANVRKVIATHLMPTANHANIMEQLRQSLNDTIKLEQCQPQCEYQVKG